ncbi:hypothetical protein PVAG01_07833 [Phlyctema vagabunda]|uniref:Uncharacterized protein n=1 Tax=Phlyctema vagabunda TaxID=108571 RepID=A0ABR4PDL6_9HELO
MPKAEDEMRSPSTELWDLHENAERVCVSEPVDQSCHKEVKHERTRRKISTFRNQATECRGHSVNCT